MLILLVFVRFYDRIFDSLLDEISLLEVWFSAEFEETPYFQWFECILWWNSGYF